MKKQAKAFGCVPSPTSTANPIIAHAPEECDLCSMPLRYHTVYYDGATTLGSWCWMCAECFTLYGIGIGVGVGQEYNSVNNQKVRG